LSIQSKQTFYLPA